MLFAYFGPETTLPLASVLAAGLGFIMMMGRRSLSMAAKFAQLMMFRSDQSSKPSDSHPMPTGLRSDQSHQAGELPSWVRPKNASTSTTSKSSSVHAHGEEN